MDEQPCADCGHEMGWHSPCSLCAGEGRTCREWVAVKTERHRGSGKRKAPTRRTPAKRRR